MSKTYTIVEKSQNNSMGPKNFGGAGWWFVLQGKFGEMAPMSFVGQFGSVVTSKGPQAIEVVDAQLRNGVLSVKLDGTNGDMLDGALVGRQAELTIGT